MRFRHCAEAVDVGLSLLALGTSYWVHVDSPRNPAAVAVVDRSGFLESAQAQDQDRLPVHCGPTVHDRRSDILHRPLGGMTADHAPGLCPPDPPARRLDRGHNYVGVPLYRPTHEVGSTRYGVRRSK
jgi:hypothetical protein